MNKKVVFNNLYNLHFDSLRRYLYFRSGSYDVSNDLAQDTFIKLWKSNFDTNEEKKIKNLLFKIGNQLFLDFIKKNKNEAEEVQYYIELSANLEDTSENQEQNKFKQKMEKALTELAEKQRIVLLLNKMEGYTHKEIASILNISVKAVEKRMSIALKNLKLKLLNAL